MRFDWLLKKPPLYILLVGDCTREGGNVYGGECSLLEFAIPGTGVYISVLFKIYS